MCIDIGLHKGPGRFLRTITNLKWSMMIKVVWLAADASLRVSGCLVSKFSLPLANRLQIPPANGKQGPVPEEMYQPS